jgi:hypothetical protein
MKFHITMFISTIALFAFSSCQSNKLAASEFRGMTIVTVRDFRSLDGCRFLLEQSDGKFLQPTKLDSAYQKEGTILGITFKPSKTPTICMKGMSVDLLTVKPKSK